jgi:aldehyde dehydrogenase (NAD+)
MSSEEALQALARRSSLPSPAQSARSALSGKGEMMISYTQIFIGGRRVDSLGPEQIEVRSPHDGELIGVAPAASTADVDLAVAAAREAFDEGPWPRMSPAERQSVIQRFIELHAERSDELARLVTKETGIPLIFTRAVIQLTGLQNQAFLKAAAEFEWETRRPGFPAAETVLRHEPVGVVAAVIPWNAPQQSATVKLIPALLAGCSVILKLALETALDGQMLGELFAEAGVPEGVISILAADREVSEYLVAHPGVDKVAFTGSTAAGKRLGAVCGGQIKRCSLELGGKSAAIILPDADLGETVNGLRYGSFSNSGQSCALMSRILVPRARHDEFVDALVEMVAGLKVGDPSDPETFIGPMVAERQRKRVANYIDLGIAEGATVAIGGPGMPEGITRGAYVRPTVFTNVDNSMRIAREEIFGPVVVVIPYDDVEDAIRIANDSPYGLAGAVCTSDREAGLAVARRVRAGFFSINGKGPDFLAPFGGFKQSGIGREFGAEGLREYSELKAITL